MRWHQIPTFFASMVLRYLTCFVSISRSYIRFQVAPIQKRLADILSEHQTAIEMPPTEWYAP